MNNYLVAIINIGYEHYELEKRLLGEIGAKVRIVDKDCRTEAQVIAASKDAHAIMSTLTTTERVFIPPSPESEPQWS